MAEQSLLARLKGKLIVGIAVGGLVYLLLLLYSGWRDLSVALADFNWLLFPLLLALAFGNYVCRFCKWHFYVGRLAISLPRADSFIIFLAGLVMTISPGKIGELLKAVLLKQFKGTPISVAAPIVVAERITDFIALVLISLAGLLVFTVASSSLAALGAVAVVLAAFLGIVSNRRLCLWLIDLLKRSRRLAHVGEKFHNAYESIYRLVRLWPLTVATFFSVMAWLCECLGFWLTLRAFTPHPAVLAACFIYALGTIVGVASPGGLGLTEGSMIGMLQTGAIMGAAKMAKAPAAAATLIIRMATLWFAVFVGAVVLLLFQGRFGDAADELEAAELSVNSEQ
jgi:uncharacterized protein (TIRG00374 family)